jgi:hypothetical protein
VSSCGRLRVKARLIDGIDEPMSSAADNKKCSRAPPTPGGVS